MDPKLTNPKAPALATGVIMGGLVLTSLAITGCNQIVDSQTAALIAETAAKSGEALANVARIMPNHNETFLVGPEA